MIVHPVRCVLLFCLVLVSALATVPAAAGAYEVVAIAVHIDTRASGGRYGVDEIAGFLEKNGIDGAIFADHDNAEITYGLFPFRHLIKKTRSFPSIETYGAGRYLEEIEEASRRHPGLILIPGTEAVPFYYWEGNPIDRNLKLVNWQEHMLVVGLTQAKQYSELPSIHRGFNGGSRTGLSMLLLPVGMMAAGVYMVRKQVMRTIQFDKLSYTTFSRWPRIPGFIVITLGVLVLVEVSPFHSSEIDQYHGDHGAVPYQKLIDYSNAQGALTFWAHPEASVTGEYEGVKYETRPYHDHLLETKNYDGFAIFWSGDREIGSPGGIWDRVLLEYTGGERERPVWAVGELDWEGEHGEDLIGETLTICFVDERSTSGVLTAMREGRMIAVREGIGLQMTHPVFRVTDPAGGGSAATGREITVTAPPLFTFNPGFDTEEGFRGEVQLIRNGRVLIESELTPGVDWVFSETEIPSPDELWYYRLVVGGEFPVLATNPVFVRGARREAHATPFKEAGL